MRKHTIIALLIGLLVISIQPQAQDNPNTWQPFDGDGTLRRVRVPILMYHYVSVLPPDADAIRRGLTLHPDIFRQHIDYFATNNYTTISLYDLDNALENGTPLPENPVILTFDDGYLDAYTEVFPVLRDSGMTGTFFIPTQFIDDNRVGYVNWAQINEMAQAGMSMEGHSKTHPALVERDFDFLVFEVMGSLESLLVHSGMIPRMFSYPAGRYDEDTLRFMASTPVERAVTTQTGTIQTTTNRYELPRMRITDETGVSALIYLLNYEG
ncbi:MAG: polysaccharide deacetylase family protein [Chloroflexota bacterium]